MGVAGIILGPLHVPSSRISEGDAILVSTDLDATYLGRRRLTGRVYSPYFSLNTDDATQAVACRIVKRGRPYTVVATHWHASIIADGPTTSILDSHAGPGAEECRAALLAGTKVREGEAFDTASFADDVSEEGDVVVVVGDFNTTLGTPEADVLMSMGYEVAGARGGGEEWPTWDPEINPNIAMQTRPENQGGRGELENAVYSAFSKRPSRLDHAFVRVKGGGDGVGAEAAVVLDGGPGGIVPSDHYGLLIEIKPQQENIL